MTTIVHGIGKVTKDPDAILDYTFDYSNWLDSGDSITTAVFVNSVGVTVNSSAVSTNGKQVTAWVQGGSVGKDASITCRITTVQGRTDDRSLNFIITQR